MVKSLDASSPCSSAAVNGPLAYLGAVRRRVKALGSGRSRSIVPPSPTRFWVSPRTGQSHRPSAWLAPGLGQPAESARRSPSTVLVSDGVGCVGQAVGPASPGGIARDLVGSSSSSSLRPLVSALKMRSARPEPRASSGSFLAPKSSTTTARIKMNQVATSNESWKCPHSCRAWFSAEKGPHADCHAVNFSPG